jgi:hypothetical protein
MSLTEIVVRGTAKRRLPWQTLVLELARGRLEWARVDEMEAQRSARPNPGPKLSKEDPKPANAKPDQPPAPAGIPSERPRSPKLHSTDA